MHSTPAHPSPLPARLHPRPAVTQTLLRGTEPVAAKVIAVGAGPSAVQSFMQEARMLRQLRHRWVGMHALTLCACVHARVVLHTTGDLSQGVPLICPLHLPACPQEYAAVCGGGAARRQGGGFDRIHGGAGQGQARPGRAATCSGAGEALAGARQAVWVGASLPLKWVLARRSGTGAPKRYCNHMLRALVIARGCMWAQRPCSTTCVQL